MMIKQCNKIEKNDIVFGVSLLFCACLYFWRAPYGNTPLDEPYYISVPFRIMMGDGLLVDEWSLAQLAGVVLYPVFKIYWLLSGGMTEGIILNFRYIYILFQLLVVTVGYIILRKQGNKASMMCLAYVLFVPAYIFTLSYNTMGYAFVFLVCALWCEKRDNKSWFMIGVVLSLAVLCNPFLVALFAYIVVVTMVEDRKISKKLIFLFLGIGLMIAYFLCILFKNSSIGEIIANIGYVVGDPTHAGRTLGQIVMQYVNGLVEVVSGANSFLNIELILCILVVIFRKRRWAGIFLVGSVLMVWPYIAAMYVVRTVYWSNIMYPLIFSGFIAFVLLQERNKNIFVKMWIPGIIYSICMIFSSNTRMNAMNVGFAISTVASVFMLMAVVEDVKSNINIKKALYGTVIMATVLMLVYMESAFLREHIVSVAIHEDISDLTEVINKGPNKGLIVCPEQKLEYDRICSDLDLIVGIEEAEQGVIVCNRYTWQYFYVGKDIATSSTCTLPVMGLYTQLQKYYEINVDKVPDYVYLYNIVEDEAVEVERVLGEQEYVIEKTDYGYLILRNDLQRCL